MVAINPELFAQHYQENPAPTTPKVATTAVPQVQQSFAVGPASPTSYLLRAPEAWDWNDVRNYVVDMILKMHPQKLPKRELHKEQAIFLRFAGKYGDKAGLIAKWAFETSPTPGRWNSAPIGLGRFSKNSDEYFADKILARLTQN